MLTRIGLSLLMISFLAIIPVRNVSAQAVPVVGFPRQDDVLQGVITISGSTDVTDFKSAEVAFTYSGDTTGTWFEIATSSQPVYLDTLATWDTTTITDGDYILRVRVYLKNGSFLDAIVQNLRVRNYTPIETPTPVPTTVQPTATMTSTITATPFPSPTSLPNNLAVLTPRDVLTSIGYGGLGAVFFLLVLGAYLGLRRR
jgi:hypothetical protein